MTIASESDARPQAPIKVKPQVIDCDIHPILASNDELKPFMPSRWYDYWQTYGYRQHQGFSKGSLYPKVTPGASRRDAWPKNGGAPGTDPELLRTQHLDFHNISTAVINVLQPNGGEINDAFSPHLCAATNEWIVEKWVRPEPRLKGAIVLPYENAEASADEIRKHAGSGHFVQALMLSRTVEPLGKKRYWPIYRAAAECNIPLAIHVFGYSGHPSTSSGWPSYYVEEGAAHTAACQAGLASLIFEGVFDELPNFRFVIVESGVAWLPALAWRLDKLWHRMRDEVPHVKRPPSEHIRERVWITTQPLDEAPRPHDVISVYEDIGWDRIMYASDYPHWDFDDPKLGLPAALTAEQRQKILFGNAQELYGL